MKSVENRSETLGQQRGAVLRAARKRAGLSARRLAERVSDRTAGSDLTDNAIYAYESGRVLLSREAAERVAETLRVPLGELLVGDPDFSAEFSGAEVQETPGLAGLAELPGAGAGGPADAARWRGACAALARLGETLSASAEVLCRQLEVPCFDLASPTRFAATFALVVADAQAVQADASAEHVALQHADAWYERPQLLIGTAKKLEECTNQTHAALARAGRKQGNCGPACAAEALKLRGVLEAFCTALGPVEQAGGRPRPA